MIETNTAQSPLYKEMLFTEPEVDARIAEMAASVVLNYEAATTLFVSLLNGALPFTAKLMRAIQETRSPLSSERSVHDRQPLRPQS